MCGQLASTHNQKIKKIIKRTLEIKKVTMSSKYNFDIYIEWSYEDSSGAVVAGFFFLLGKFLICGIASR